MQYLWKPIAPIEQVKTNIAVYIKLCPLVFCLFGLFTTLVVQSVSNAPGKHNNSGLPPVDVLYLRTSTWESKLKAWIKAFDVANAWWQNTIRPVYNSMNMYWPKCETIHCFFPICFKNTRKQKCTQLPIVVVRFGFFYKK